MGNCLDSSAFGFSLGMDGEGVCFDIVTGAGSFDAGPEGVRVGLGMNASSLFGCVAKEGSGLLGCTVDDEEALGLSFCCTVFGFLGACLNGASLLPGTLRLGAEFTVCDG